MPITPARIFVSTLLILVAFGTRAWAVEVTGAGSTFVFPLLAKWAAEYRALTGDVVNYQSIGSGGGIKQIENGTVDFGATDMPLTPGELATHQLTQFPLIAGSVVPVVHLRGVADGELKLTGAILADVYLGRILRWNDSRLRDLNPRVALPDRLITVVHRADQSGTSFIWTGFLSATSDEWRRRFGPTTAPAWPVGIGGKGNEGVASFVKTIDGAIGYVESAFAHRARMTSVRVKNRAGQFVPGDASHVRAALGAVDWSPPVVSLVNAPGDASWPLAGVTFVLWRNDRRDQPGPRAARAFVAWAFAHGDPSAERLHYVPLPREARRTGGDGG